MCNKWLILFFFKLFFLVLLDYVLFTNNNIFNTWTQLLYFRAVPIIITLSATLKRSYVAVENRIYLQRYLHIYYGCVKFWYCSIRPVKMLWVLSYINWLKWRYVLLFNELMVDRTTCVNVDCLTASTWKRSYIKKGCSMVQVICLLPAKPFLVK